MITEDQLEQRAIQWFQDTGKLASRTPSPRPSPTGRGRKAAEREALRTLTPALSHGEKEEDGRLLDAVRRLNPKLPESAVEEVRRRVVMPGQVSHVMTKPEHPPLVQRNWAA